MAQTPHDITITTHQPPPLTAPSLLIRFLRISLPLLLVVLLYLPILMSVASKPSKKNKNQIQKTEIETET